MSVQSILIVDDSEPEQFFVRALIKKYDPEISVIDAFDGAEALAVLDAMGDMPDIIFLDVNMPGMNGFEFLAKYKEKYKQSASKVLMLSSSDQECDKQKALSYDFVKDYFIKPLTPQHLEVLKDI